MKKTQLFIILLLISNFVFSQKVSLNETQTILTNFLQNNEQIELLSQKYEIINIYSDISDELLFYAINFPSAYIIISADKKYSPIKAFSFQNKLNTDKNSNFSMINILKSDYEEFNLFLKKNPEIAQKNIQKWEKYTLLNQKKNEKDATFGPWIKSLYGQVNCHDSNGNLVNVTNYYTPNNYAIGCVALTFTEVLQYYSWPRKGTDSHTYTDNYGTTTGSHTANFEEDYYNWDLALDLYDEAESTEQERMQLGKIAFHAAVSVDMDFEYNGSTSNINRIPSAAKKYFRYYADYKEKEDDDFWSILDSNLVHQIPAQFAIYTSGGSGHAIICDGIKYENNDIFYHLNMGWWGDDNGWYKIRESFNAGGYSNITAAVLNMIPIPELSDKPTFDTENKTATIKWYYPEKVPAQNFEIQLKKGVADWETLTDTITSKSFTIQTDGESDYLIRIRAKSNNTWFENSYSNSISIKPEDFIAKGDDILTLYPNFVENDLKISYENLKGSTLKIYNLQGKLIYENNENIELNEYHLDLSFLPSGFYILQLNNGKRKEGATAKFFKL